MFRQSVKLGHKSSLRFLINFVPAVKDSKVWNLDMFSVPMSRPLLTCIVSYNISCQLMSRWNYNQINYYFNLNSKEHSLRIEVNKSRDDQFGVTSHFSTGQSLLNKISRQDKY